MGKPLKLIDNGDGTFSMATDIKTDIDINVIKAFENIKNKVSYLKIIGNYKSSTII